MTTSPRSLSSSVWDVVGYVALVLIAVVAGFLYFQDTTSPEPVAPVPVAPRVITPPEGLFDRLSRQAHAGDVVSQRQLGQMYLSGMEVRADDAEALKWAFWTVTEIEADALTVLMHRMVMPEERRKPELANAAEKRLAGPLRVLEQHLQAQAQRGQAHLAADRFTIADVCVASVVNWVRPAKELMAQHPLVLAWLMACMDRPAQRQAKASGA